MVPFDISRITETFRSKRWSFEIAAEESHAATCREELIRRLPHILPESWTERFQLGGVYLSGREASPDTIITPPSRLEYFEPSCDLHNVHKYYPPFLSEMVVWGDDDIAIAVKPSGLPTTAPRDQKRFTFEAYLYEHFKRAVHLPSRLDTGVSGLLIVSLSTRMNRYLQRAYDRKSIEKYYMVEVEGDFPHQEIDIHEALARDPRHPVLRRVVESGGDSAHTHIRKVRTYQRDGRGYSLLQAEPRTGRTHQIRVHLSSMGFPIVGDPYYGGAHAQQLRLLSFSLHFHHPYMQEQMSFELPLAGRPEWFQTIERMHGPIQIERSIGRYYESHKNH